MTAAATKPRATKVILDFIQLMDDDKTLIFEFFINMEILIFIFLYVSMKHHCVMEPMECSYNGPKIQDIRATTQK